MTKDPDFCENPEVHEMLAGLARLALFTNGRTASLSEFGSRVVAVYTTMLFNYAAVNNLSIEELSTLHEINGDLAWEVLNQVDQTPAAQTHRLNTLLKFPQS